MLDLSGAPGCYGMGTLFKESSNECSTCPFGDTCGPKAVLQLATIRAELGIVVRKQTPKRLIAEPTVSPAANPFNLPKKAAELMDRIEGMGIRVTESLGQGLNPFTTKPAFMRVTCHLLLRFPVGIKRDLLTTCFMTKLNWSKGTADAHVIQAIQVLKALGAADEVDGALRLRNSK